MDDLLRKIERIALAAALIAAAFYAHMFNGERALREQREIAEKGLPPGVLAQYVLENRKLTEMVRNAQGKTEVRVRYVPDEAKVTVLTKERNEAIAQYQALLEKLKNAKTPDEVKRIEDQLKTVSDGLNKPPEVIFRDWGLTSRFGYGLAFSPGHKLDLYVRDGMKLSVPISPQLDWKWGYWGRYSGLIQANMFYVGPEFTRHIDDVTPRWLHMNNMEFGVSGGKEWKGGWAVGTNLRSNF
jgi:hypothetical protein